MIVILIGYLILILICAFLMSVILFHFKKIKIIPDITDEKVLKIFFIGNIFFFIFSLIFLILL